MSVLNLFKYLAVFAVGAIGALLSNRIAEANSSRMDGDTCSGNVLLSRDLLNSKIAAINSFAVIRKLDSGDVTGAKTLANVQLDSELNMITQASKMLESGEQRKSSLELMRKVENYRRVKEGK